jgi:hypothetical protein
MVGGADSSVASVVCPSPNGRSTEAMDDLGGEMDLKPGYYWFKEYRHYKSTIALVLDGFIHNCFLIFSSGSIRSIGETEEWQWGERIDEPKD